MKKRILTLGLIGSLCAIGFTSCNKIKEKLFPAFDADISEVSVNIPVTVAGAEATSNSTVSFNLDSTIKANTASAFGVNSVSSVKVKNVQVFLENADDQNDVSNFENVSLKFASNTNSTPLTVLSSDIPDVHVTDINLPVTNSPELKNYLTGTQLTYFITGQARRSTTKPLSATVIVTLSIK